MSRDYAKRSGSRKKSNLAIWIILLLAFILFVSALILIKKDRQSKHEPKQKITDIKKTITTPKFDFYKTSTTKKIDNSKNTYTLEIATVDNFAAADHLKAKLTLLGFTVNIKPILKLGKRKYYISVGPYDSKDKALTEQKRLKRNKIKSLLK